MTIKDLQSARLFAQEQVMAWHEDWMRMWTKPITDVGLALIWDGLTPEEKEQLKAENPDAFEAFDDYRRSLGGYDASMDGR